MNVNIHERQIAASADAVGELLETWGAPGDRFWHTELDAPTQLDRGVAVGSRGGHGLVRYSVVEHEPKRMVEVEFEPGSPLRGRHRFTVTPTGSERCVLRHELFYDPHGIFRLLGPAIVEPMHDATLEDVLDHIEHILTGQADRGQVTPRWVRAIAPRVITRWVERSTRAPSPLQAASLDRIDYADAWSTPLLPEDTDDPAVWMHTVAVGLTEGLSGRLMRLGILREGPFGLLRNAGRPLSPTGFPVLGEGDGELLMGADDRSFDFRVAFVIDARVLHLVTTIQLHDIATTDAKWRIIRLVHRSVVRGMLRNAPVPVRAG